MIIKLFSVSRDNVKAQKYLNMILYVIADGKKKVIRTSKNIASKKHSIENICS